MDMEGSRLGEGKALPADRFPGDAISQPYREGLDSILFHRITLFFGERARFVDNKTRNSERRRCI